MTRGTQLKIYLANGSVTGIRHAEIVNWTGQAIAVPRVHIKELSEWEETQRPGVYFLFGYNAESGNSLVYVGEAEHIQKRLSQHLAGKEFWNEAICFTNKDENLTKAHVKYLEARLIEIILESKRYDLDNEKQPPTSSLPRGERDAMETFIDNIRTVIGSLGHKLLESKVSQTNAPLPSEPESMVLQLKVKKVNAKAMLTDEGIVVLKGSQALTIAQPSLSKGYTKLRSNLEDKGILASSGDRLVAAEDILFTSASQAAAVLLGYPCSGPDYWRSATGKTLKEIEEESI
ncbi:GIY-YIG nuclease family protein [Vibrio splendidus]|uniref:GIY-YIG nuclease family protein n=1 Tax=Vibrio splendidus TaxID=29497 RepID=A0A7Y4D8D1_VIBSP|nr:GIY-YIG nuclease family protein [Vibrio splendidus]NOJ13646.1 GIY-YIG nuclease family protein [Vibrio splendidus]